MKTKFVFTFDEKTRKLYHLEQCVCRLNVVEARILEAFVRSPEGLVERDRLLDIAWPNKDVTPNSLNVAIKKIRGIFFPIVGQEVITTHFKKGFSWNHQCVTCIINTNHTDENEFPVVISTPSETEKIEGEHIVRENKLDCEPPLIENDEHKPIRSSGISLFYYLSCAVLILVITLHILFYTTQVVYMSCEPINRALFCGYGALTVEVVPPKLHSGNYIYVNSQKNGFRYVEIK